MACEEGHVAVALAQRGQLDAAAREEDEEEVIREASAGDVAIEVAARAGDEAEVVAGREEILEAGLDVAREVSDLVDEERAALRLLDEADLAHDAEEA